MFEGMFNGMFGRIGNGMCRLSINGDIAIKTSTGYKVYNIKKGTLTNCSNFVFNIGEEFFFVIPTNKVAKGDIVLINNSPKCVIEAEKNKITAIDFESSEIKTIIPERHIFLGQSYFYGKIVSMFGLTGSMKSKNSMNRILQFMMMGEMMKGMGGNNNSALPATTGASNSMAQMLPFMMMGGMGMNMGNMFEGIFDVDSDDEFDESTDDKLPDTSDEEKEDE